MRKYLFFFVLLYFFGFIRPSFIFSASNFTTDYNTEYNVLENGNANVIFNVTLTNKTSKFYASSYSIKVGFKNITDVVARDASGIIKSRIVKTDDGNSIELVFNKKVVGLNQKRLFSVSFSTQEIAQKSGMVWDINIPGLARQNEFRNFNVKVTVPKTLGAPSYIKPNIHALDGNVFSFTKEELGESGISISFGKEEIYEFDLSYHLRNNNLFPVKTEIALPPSTNYQDVTIEKIAPEPLNVVKDQDGNWLAKYTLSPSKELEIKVTGKARISLHPKKQIESKEKLALYLKPQTYWETSDKKIKELAATLITPYEIYEYVIKSLKYDFSRVSGNLPRLGAKEVVNNPNSAVCLEFTDLFIAIARAAGIPAREVNGFAYTQNSKEKPLSLVKDVLHSRPQYYDYDLETWVMIDPTWGNTTGGVDYFYTLDFDHFAFVIKGANSIYPIPAGGYKTKNDDSKNINVKFSGNFTDSSEIISISENFNSDYSSFEKVSGSILVRNIGNTLSTPQTILVRNDSIFPSEQKIGLVSIPPFGYLEIPVTFDRQSLLTNKEANITIQVNEESLTKNIKISPFTINKWSVGGILFVTLIITAAIIKRAWNLPFLG